jgi:hypothetical protein
MILHLYYKKGGYMNKRLALSLSLSLMPLGILFLGSCGPVDSSTELALDESSDNFVGLNEYGRCNDAWDNDGNGLVDMSDPACHFPGPLKDLSVAPPFLGHNFAPDISLIPPGGPGFGGSFRNHEQITRWMRFLTDTYGITAGIDLYGASLDSPAVPLPVPLFPKVLQGTAAQGNNNNINALALPFLGGGPAPLAPAPAPAPLPAIPATHVNLDDAYNPSMYQGHHHGYGHPNMKNYQDRKAAYERQSLRNNLGSQSNNFQQQAQPEWPRATMSNNRNDLSSSNFGQPKDWPESPANYAQPYSQAQQNPYGQHSQYQQRAYGQQQPTQWPQAQ